MRKSWFQNRFKDGKINVNFKQKRGSEVNNILPSELFTNSGSALMSYN